MDKILASSRRCKSFRRQWLLICLVCLAAAGHAQAEANVKDSYSAKGLQQYTERVGQLRNPEIKQAAERYFHALQVSKPDQQQIADIENAIIFFHDLKAKALLLALMRQHNFADDVTAGSIVLQYGDLFTTEDIPQMYEAADSFGQEIATVDGRRLSLTTDSHIKMPHSWYIQKLAERTSELLKLKYVPATGRTKEAVRLWWLNAYKEAERQGNLGAALDINKRYFTDLAKVSYATEEPPEFKFTKHMVIPFHPQKKQ